MMDLLKNKIIGAFIIFLFCSATSIFACTCFNSLTKDTIKNSSLVFSGKVVGLEYRKGIPNQYMDQKAKETGSFIDYETLVVKVQVEQWWKGDVPTEVVLLTNTTRTADTRTSSSCDFYFLKDETYLVFANGKKNEYRTGNCSGTQKLDQAEEDLKILGEGKKPIEIINEMHLPL